ncbi:MAG TPA: F0F1 ATP synthase subunit B' [Rhodospirillales bacterium]|nr:F0F1 ATP synthase subunit B' [Rhodospirillales bacterium]
MRKLMASPIIATVLVGLSSPAQAAGLPQLDISKFPPQIIWLVLTFTVLYLVMSRVALPRVSQVLEERQRRIEDYLGKAEDLQKEARAAAEAYEESLAEARAEAHRVMVDTISRIAEDSARQQARLSEHLDAQTRSAEQHIDQARDAAMASLDQVAGDVAQASTEKLIGETLNKKEVAAVVARIMEERR